MQEEQYLLSEDRRPHGGLGNMDTGRRTEPEAEESAYHSDEFKTKLELVAQRMVATNILAGLSLYKGELALARETCHSEEGAGHTRGSSDISEDWTTGNKEQSIIHAGSREDESLCRKREIFAETLAQKTLWDALNVFGTGDAKLKERRNDPRDLRNGVPFPDNDTAAAPEETNDPTEISIPQDGISFDEEKLGTICDELFDLCLESRFDAMETSRKVEFALADISRKNSLEATQVASLHGTVETMKEAHAKLIEVYDCVTEGIAHQKTDKEEITVSFPDTLVLKAKRSRLEISGESCRLLGSAIAELVKNIASAVEKNNEVHTEKQIAMKQKLRRRKRSFSETLGEKHAEIEGLIKENAQMKDIIEEGRMEKLSIEAFIDSLSRENEKLVDEVEALSREQTAEREAHRQEVDSMAAEDQYKEREICNLRRDLKRKESQIKLIESEYDKALAREDASLLLVEDSEATSRKRQEQLKQLESYFTDLRDDVQNLTQEVAAGRTAEENTPDCSGFRVTHGGAERSMGTLTAAQSRTEGGEIDRHASSALGSSRRMAREARQSRSKSMLLGVQPLGEGIRNATLEMKRLKKRAASLGLQNREMRMEVEKLRMRLEETSSPQQDRSYQAKVLVHLFSPMIADPSLEEWITVIIS